MLTCLAFHQGDVALVKDLLQWMSELGGCKDHDCLLVADHDVAWQEFLYAHRLARDVFKSVELTVTREPVKGWIPGSCALFRLAAETCAGRPFLWLEPDAAPLRPGWINEFDNHYANCGKAFMGTLVTHSMPNFPNPYFEGCGVYPADCWERLKSTWRPDQSWTRSCAPVVVPEAASTPLIHHLWGERDNPPTFAEKNRPGTNVFCLDQISSEAALFHRNKDGTLIRQLRRKFGIKDPELPPAPNPKCFIQLGRYGDLILLMPAFLEWSKRTRRNVVVVTSEEFGTVFDGVSYVDPIRLKIDWQNGLPAAITYAQQHWRDVTLLQLNGGGISPEPDGLPSFMLTMWKRTGLIDDYKRLPLVFDKRCAQREEILINGILKNGKPLLLYNTSSWTSPLNVKTEAPVLGRILASVMDSFQLVNIGTMRAFRVYDLLGLFDIAAGLVTIDTMALHLAPGSKLPYIAITRSDYRAGSIPKGNCVLNVGYRDIAAKSKLITETIRSWKPA